ncbi:bridge-like lipid transfer protein family member 3B isoform X1 [Scylla paramamosain]|uniref:bridge-like lipid transfer protein family member 3B isoform X1 n=2 Tax=Scylla paramamosain TaxID=85552 RepID=UPI003082EAE8
MAGLIKNQILKHLSKFAKNVSSDSVNVSTLKGEGELTNLELNETVLTDLLELPIWLRITRALVNRVNLKIQWTKLKSVPIAVSLDEVQVEMETCSELRSHQSGSSVLPSYGSGGRYGFADKVIDGMTVTVNSVLITFRSHAFHATFQLSRIVLDSKNPLWQKADLRQTRLKDVDRGELLIFKELSWQTLRVEAKSTCDQALTPLRLITNQARCRITIKKKLTDCSVVGCRLVLLMDDLLWVLTDSQLTAAFHFIDSLSDLVKQAAQESQKTKAVRKLESLPEFQVQLAQQVQQARGSGSSQGRGSSSGGSSSRSSSSQSNVVKVFSKYDVPETSYHFYSERIDLHFCDDPGPGRSSHPDLSGGAALQVTLAQLEIDFYPYHLAAGDRGHWVKYSTECGPAVWAHAALAQFKTLLTDTLNSSRSSHTPLARAPPHTRHDTPHQSSSGRTAATPPGDGVAQVSPLKGVVATQLKKLMSSCCVLRVNDFCVYRVSTSKRKQTPKEFVSAGHYKKQRKKTGDKGKFKLPTQVASLHLEFTVYYFPAATDFPVPPPKLYLQLNPVQITFDPLSILWLNSFGRSLQRAVLTDPPPPPSYLDVHLEAVMPKVIVEGLGEHSNQRDRPQTMHIQASRVILSNVRPPDPTLPGSLASLATSLEAAQQGELFFASSFPASSSDFQPICHKFVRHATGEDNVRSPPVTDSPLYETISNMKKDALWLQARDILFLHCEPLWVEFFGVPAARSRPVPFVDAFPVSLWMYIKPKASLSVATTIAESCEGRGPRQQGGEGVHSEPLGRTYKDEEQLRSGSGVEGQKPEAAIHMFAHVPSLVSAQLNHYQYLFLMRQLDVITELTSYLTYDTINILTHPHMAGVALARENLGDTLVLAAVVPQVDVSLVMPPPHPGKDSMAGDMESFLPDSSSTADLHDLGSPSCEVRNSASDHSIMQKVIEPDACSVTSDITKSYSVDQLTSPQPKLGTTSVTRQPSSTANGNISQPPVCQQSPVNTGMQHSPSAAVKHAASRQLSSSLTNLPRSTKSHSPHADPAGVNGPMMQLNLHGNLNAGFTSVRKGLTSGFTNLMSTIESAVKTSPEDMSDTLSVRSDLSSDSDNFIMVNIETDRTDSGLGGMDALFRVDNRPATSVEVASEVFEEPTPSEVSDVTSSFRRRDVISVVTFKLSRVQVVQESRGYESTVKVQCCQMVCEECSNMGYDEFQKRPGCNDGRQSKFSSRCRGWSESMEAIEPCCLKLRLDTHAEALGAEEEPPCGISGAPLPMLIRPFLKGEVADLNLTLMMSTVTNLVDLIEDEIVPEPLPMEIMVERVGLRLTEDRVPANITSPGSVPTEVWLPKLLVKRNLEGVFTLLPQKEEDKELLSIKKERDKLREDLRQVRQQMNQVLAENRSLQTTLAKMQEDKERERSSRGFSLPKFPLP